MKLFKTTTVAVGESFSLTLIDVAEGKFGPALVGLVNGEEVQLQTSGNLRFMIEDLSKGKRELNKAYTVTRIADIQHKGYPTTQYAITDGAAAPAAAPAQSVADKLAAIRAKKTV